MVATAIATFTRVKQPKVSRRRHTQALSHHPVEIQGMRVVAIIQEKLSRQRQEEKKSKELTPDASAPSSSDVRERSPPMNKSKCIGSYPKLGYQALALKGRKKYMCPANEHIGPILSVQLAQGCDGTFVMAESGPLLTK